MGIRGRDAHAARIRQDNRTSRQLYFTLLQAGTMVSPAIEHIYCSLLGANATLGYGFPPPMNPPRLATVSIVRNEADIIETFVRHHAAHATRMVIVLHRCLDNTADILQKLQQEEGLPLELHEVTDIGHPQARVLSERIRSIVAQGEADWILPLDADEFLIVAEGRSVADALENATRDRVQLLPWKTYVPTPEDNIAESNPLRRIVYRKHPETPPFFKILLPVALLKTIPWRLPMGSHAIHHAQTGEPLPSIASAILSLAHFPVRGADQLTEKILGGHIADAATPGTDPRRSSHWRTLSPRLSTGRPLSPIELRNIALRYAIPEGSPAVPGLFYDPVQTPAGRPRMRIQPVSPMAVVMENALACAETVAREREEEDDTDLLEAFTRGLRSATDRLRRAFMEGDVADSLPADHEAHAEEAAFVCALSLCAAAASLAAPPEGSALTRRQTLGANVPALPQRWSWIATVLRSNKLPFMLERTLQELIVMLLRQDFAALRQQCRRESATDDVVLVVCQRMTAELRPPVALALGTFLSQAVHALLKEEAHIDCGLGDPRIRVMHMSAGRGELAGEFLRRMVNTGVERGANPDTLRREIIEKLSLEEPSAALRAIATVRLSAILQSFRMPLSPGETLPIGVDAARVAPGTVPVICAAVGEGIPAPYNVAVETILARYLRRLQRGTMERDAVASRTLRGIARVHALMLQSETSIGALVAPRSVLHSYAGSGMREALLEDVEHIRILDLHGNSGEEKDDEPLEGGDGSGLCLLLLVRSPAARQRTLTTEWKGLNIQKHHALLSRAFSDLPWHVTAPDAPGYVFLP